MNEKDLKAVLKKPGYSLKSSFGSELGKGSFGSQVSRKGPSSHVESVAILESLRAEKLSLNYSGKPRVIIRFYRRRLADSSRSCSEKAYVDGLQYAGLIIGDSSEEIRLIDGGQHKVETKEEERFEVDIEYDEVDFDNLWVKAAKNNAR